MKVLICDDEENIRKLLKRLLKIEGIDADVAENGLSAQRMISEERYDAVIADLRMPGLDGLSLIRWIRHEGFRIPVIMISAHGDINDAVTALKECTESDKCRSWCEEELRLSWREQLSWPDQEDNRADRALSGYCTHNRGIRNGQGGCRQADTSSLLRLVRAIHGDQYRRCS